MFDAKPELNDAITIGNRKLKSLLKQSGREIEYLEVAREFDRRVPEAVAKAFGQLEEFFNYNLYDYKVQVGETKEVK
jgi:uncharacterized protein YcgL (UPF0745 family)